MKRFDEKNYQGKLSKREKSLSGLDFTAISNPLIDFPPPQQGLMRPYFSIAAARQSSRKSHRLLSHKLPSRRSEILEKL
jgi:hypothetical protein